MPFIGNREFAVKAVGESFYDSNLRELCGPAADHMRQFRQDRYPHVRERQHTTKTPFALT